MLKEFTLILQSGREITFVYDNGDFINYDQTGLTSKEIDELFDLLHALKTIFVETKQ